MMDNVMERAEQMADEDRKQQGASSAPAADKN
jgi:hypothetical protein